MEAEKVFFKKSIITQLDLNSTFFSLYLNNAFIKIDMQKMIDKDRSLF